ncbi:GntR family transcriptional regulator [Catenulispora pinisilvae]|uniref:GntR family transcriptional regulator n=1 Tax=Catenulispora pinisilvae TaxID=2705253 RepID=UPI00189256C2|nr:GntR family transcriptional regulator [Catenulispora pinisilvae]
MSARADVETTLRGWLADGTLVPDQRLPSENDLIDRLEASRNTIRVALKKLIDEGRLRSEHGRGYYVCRPRRADPGVAQWKRQASVLVVEDPRFDVERVELASQAGQQENTYVLRSLTVVATAVLSAPDRLLMVWRYRPGIGTGTWELPGGPVAAGEEPAVAAVRLTEEQTGVQVSALRHVLSFQPLPEIADAPHEIFAGQHGGLRVGRSGGDSDLAAEWIPFSEVPDLVASGRAMGTATLLATLAIAASTSPEVQRSFKWVNSFRARR